MKVKRVTFEVEVPFECGAEIAVQFAMAQAFRRSGIPYQMQTVSVEVSTSTQIGDVKEWP